MNNYIIYKHVNKINGKIYIGQTCQKPEYRWNHGQGYKNCSYFYKAIQKYGWDNFEHIILEQNLSLEEANQKERYYINLYQSNNTLFGYNLLSGGNNRTQIADSTREKLSKHAKQMWSNENIRINRSIHMKEKWQDPEYKKNQSKGYQKALEQLHKNGKTSFISEEGRKRISEARKKYIAEHGTPTQGKGHTEATKKILSEQKKGSKNPMYGKKPSEYQIQKTKEAVCKKVQCIETQQIFNSRVDAAKWCGLKSSSGITENINGRKKSAGKHPNTGEKLHWRSID